MNQEPAPQDAGNSKPSGVESKAKSDDPSAVLYYSPLLAHNMNLAFGDYHLHGLIDATGPGSTLWTWCDDGWEILRDGLPADALRLVCEVPT